MAGRSPHVLYRPEEVGRDAGRCGGCRPRGRGSGEDAQPLPGPPHLRGRDGRDPAPGRAVRGAAGDGQDLHRQGDGGGGRSAVLVRVLVGFPIDVLRADQPQDPFVLPCPAQLCPARGWRHRLHRGNRRHRRHPGRDRRRSGPRGHRRSRERITHTTAVFRRAAFRGTRRQCGYRCGQPLVAAHAHSRKSGWPNRPTSLWSGPPTGPPTSTRRYCARAASTRPSGWMSPAAPAGARFIDYYLARKAHDPELDDPPNGTPCPGRPSGIRR